MPDMNENAETQQEYFGRMTEYEKQKEWIRDKFRETMLTECERKDKRIVDLEKENAELKRIVKMVAMINKGIYTEEGIKAIYAEAEHFLKE